jgi:DNA-binding CsgD family transcriptional regulator/tetratricopeptide (TPR) repeat protein
VFPVLLLGRNGTIAELPPGVVEDLHAGIVCALVARAEHDGSGDVTAEARRIVELLIPGERGAGTAAHELPPAGYGTVAHELPPAGYGTVAHELPPAGYGTAAAMVASTVRSNQAWAQGRLDEAMRWGRRAVELTTADVPASWRPYTHLALAEKLIDIGELREAEGLVEAADREASRQKDRPASIDVELSQGRLLYASSKFRAARRMIRDAVERANSIGADWTTRYGLLLLALIDLRGPALSTAITSMWRCRAEFVRDRLLLPSPQYRWCEFLVSSIGLSAQRSVELLSGEYSSLLSSPALFVLDAAAAPWLVRLAQVADDLLLATNIAALAQDLAAANPAYPAVVAAARHARALLAGDADGLRAVASAHCDVWAAKLAMEHMKQLRPLRPPAPEPIAAVEGGTAVAAVEPTAAPLEADLAAAGGGRLTKTEKRIAHMVSRGLTNQQIARSLGRSPHTVNYHLRRIFEKLDLRSRVELATYVIQENQGS